MKWLEVFGFGRASAFPMPWQYARCQCDGETQDCKQCARARRWRMAPAMIVLTLTFLLGALMLVTGATG